MMKRRATVSLALGAVVLLLIAVVLLLVVFLIIPKLVALFKSAYECDGGCYSVCPEDYVRDRSGDAYCTEMAEEGDASGNRCCLPGETAPGAPAAGDIRIIANGKKDSPIRNGGTMELLMRTDSQGLAAVGDLAVSFDGSIEDKQCYWQIGDGDIMEDVIFCNPSENPKSNLFSMLFNVYGSEFNLPTGSRENTCPRDRDLSDTRSCETFEGKSELIINNPEIFQMLGERFKINLVVIDEDSCDADDDVDLCDSYVHSFWVQVPDRNPSVSLKVDGKQASTSTANVLTVGGTHRFDIAFEEPLKGCEVQYLGFIPTIGLTLPFTNTRGISGDQSSLVFEPDCISNKIYRHTLELTISDDFARGIPFEMILETFMQGSDARKVTMRFPFLIAPEDRVKVYGPAPGLTREKVLDISCPDAQCKGFEMAYINDPMQCTGGNGGANPSWFKPIQPEVYGDRGSNRWRHYLASQAGNGLFVCIKADTEWGPIYSIGLYDGMPSRKAVDNVPPLLTVGFNVVQSLKGIVELDCVDQRLQEDTSGEYVSGCARRPYSYAYVTDPLKFIASVLSGGALADTFNACPDPDTGYWIMYNSDSDEMPFLGSDVRVLCVRATDNAGNHAVKAKLLYNSMDVLAALLTEYAEHS